MCETWHISIGEIHTQLEKIFKIFYRIGKCKIATRAELVEARPPAPSASSGYGYGRAEGTFL